MSQCCCVHVQVLRSAATGPDGAATGLARLEPKGWCAAIDTLTFLLKLELAVLQHPRNTHDGWLACRRRWEAWLTAAEALTQLALAAAAAEGPELPDSTDVAWQGSREVLQRALPCLAIALKAVLESIKNGYEGDVPQVFYSITRQQVQRLCQLAGLPPAEEAGTLQELWDASIKQLCAREEYRARA